MGRMKELAIELEESEMDIDFDQRNYTDGAWWAEQDAEMVREELKQIESDADIFQEQRGGYL
jgi:hypothetical protein